MMAKPQKRMNRRTFWTWAIPIVVAHVALTFAFVSGAGATFLGNIDTVLIVCLAVAVARRFRDIGWPAWTGATFMIVTMLVVPIGLIGYAFASHPTSQELLQWITYAGWVSGPLNLMLILVAGCVPGQPDADAQIASEFS
jgi:uncharacterized membrane protein YhaH (DUF805 family)